jgi:hypothetical protein
MKCSLEWLNSNDYEMMATVFGEIDMVNDIMIFSDRCTPKEIQKLDEEFKKELSR